MSTLAGITGKLALDATQWSSGLHKAEGDLGRFVRRSGSGFTSLAATAAKALGGIGLVAGTALAGAVAASTKTAISVESAFAGVIKTTDGLVDAQGRLTASGATLKQGFRDLALTIPTSVEDLMRIGELGGQLGIAKEGLLGFTETIAMLGTSTNLSVEEGAMALARFANVMGTTEGDIGRVGAAIVDLGNNFATTERDVMAFAERIAGAGKIAGMAEYDVLGIGAALSSVGVQAEAGGTAVQKVLFAMTAAAQSNGAAMIDNSDKIAKVSTKLEDLRAKLDVARLKQGEFTAKTKESTRAANAAKIGSYTKQIAHLSTMLEALSEWHGMEDPSAKLAIFAETAGMTSEQFITAWKSEPVAAFQDFVEGLGRQGGEAMATLEALELGDARLQRAFLSLAGAGDLLGGALERADVAFGQNTALVEEAAKRYATTESQIALLKNTFRDMGITIGSAVLPMLNDLLARAKPFIADFAAKLPGILQNQVIPALESLWEMGGRVVRWLGDLRATAQETWGALTTTLAPVTAAIGTFAANLLDVGGEALTEVRAAFTREWPTILATVRATLATLRTIWGAVWPYLQGVLKVSLGNIGTLFRAGLAVLPQVITLVGALLRGDWQGVWDAVVGIATTMGEALITVVRAKLDLVLGWFGTSTGEVLTLAQSLWGQISAAVGEKVGQIEGAVSPVLARVVALWTEHGPGVVAAITTAYGAVRTWIETTLAGLVTLWEEHGPGVVAAITTAYGAVGAWIETTLGNIATVITAVLADIRAWWEKHGEAVRIVAEGLWAGLQLLFKGALAILGALVTVGLAAIEKAWAILWPALETLASGAWTTLATLWEGALGTLGALFEVFAGLLTGDWERVWTGLKTLAETQITLAKTIIETTLNTILGLFGTSLGELETAWAAAWDAVEQKIGAVAGKIIGFVEGIKTAISEATQKARDFAAEHNVVGGIVGRALGVGGYATGTNFFPGIGVVGERGPELLVGARGAQVIPLDALGALLGGGDPAWAGLSRALARQATLTPRAIEIALGDGGGKVPRFATGTPFFPGVGVVGERGPELLVGARGAQVIPLGAPGAPGPLGGISISVGPIYAGQGGPGEVYEAARRGAMEGLRAAARREGLQ